MNLSRSASSPWVLSRSKTVRRDHPDSMILNWFRLLTQCRFLALVGFKAATEVYAIVEGPNFCINAFVDLPSVKFCGKVFGVPIPCGFSWERIPFKIIVRHTQLRTTMLLSSSTRPPRPTAIAPVSRLPRTVHGH